MIVIFIFTCRNFKQFVPTVVIFRGLYISGVFVVYTHILKILKQIPHPFTQTNWALFVFLSPALIQHFLEKNMGMNGEIIVYLKQTNKHQQFYQLFDVRIYMGIEEA